MEEKERERERKLKLNGGSFSLFILSSILKRKKLRNTITIERMVDTRTQEREREREKEREREGKERVTIDTMAYLNRGSELDFILTVTHTHSLTKLLE